MTLPLGYVVIISFPSLFQIRVMYELALQPRPCPFAFSLAISSLHRLELKQKLLQFSNLKAMRFSFEEGGA